MKNYIVFSTPRTGSTLMYFLLWAYYRAKYNDFIFLDEYFNELHYNLFYEDIFNSDGQQIKRINHTEPGENRYRFVPKEYDNHFELIKEYDSNPVFSLSDETTFRLNLLKKHINGKNYFLRIHASPLNDDVFSFLNDNYTFVCTERENIMEQILSYGIATHRKVWADLRGKNKVEPTPPEEKSILMTQESVLDISKRILDYHLKKSLIKNKIVISYEEIIKFSDEYQIYNLLGINDWMNVFDKKFIKTRLPFKPSFGDKRQYFQNINEIEKWKQDFFGMN